MSINRHLAKAKDYIGKGDAFYRKAAKEIEAARAEGLRQADIAAALGKSQAWVSDLLKYQDTDKATPWEEPRGAAREASTATKVLERSTPEQIRDVLRALPRDQVQAVQRAALDAEWEQSDAAEAERSGLTPTGVRKQREASQQTGRRTLGVLDALIGLDKARGGLEAAVEALTEATPTEEEWSKFDWRLGQIEQAVEVVRATRARTGDWDAALAELQS